MNERIDQLLVKAGAYFGGEGVVYDRFDPKKFAELFVQDACAVLQNWKKEPFPFDEDLAVSLLKEHFGVEE